MAAGPMAHSKKLRQIETAEMAVTAAQAAQIRRLDDHVVNKIAAGEVIERPASVLKELLENSVDASARRIEVEILAAGTQKIQVRDDGTGIHKDEIRLALARHATSKMRSFSELEGVQTLGFRGEALPSIASVSRFCITTRTAQAANGWKVLCSGGAELVGPQPAQHAVGTTIAVEDLFYNVPARRKFLRSAATENAHIDKLIKRMVLSQPAIEISIAHNARRGVRYPPVSDSLQWHYRLQKVFGEAFCDNCIELEHSGDSLSVTGWIGAPDYTRTQADQQYLFVNGRAVQDRSVMHAVRQAYMDVLFDRTRYPVCALFLQIDAARVDVNVHPSKTEVRFRAPREVYNFVKSATRRALAGETPAQRLARHSRPAAEGVLERPPADAGSSQRFINLMPAPPWPASSEPGLSRAAPPPFQPAEETDINFPPLGFALAQLGGAYILAENKEGLIIVDVHAAHERIKYQQLKDKYRDARLSSQALIVPVIVKVSTQEADAAQENSALLEQLGFDVSLAGTDIVSVRSVPELLKNLDINQLIRDILADLMTHGSTSQVEHIRDTILAAVSCHSAIRANQKLNRLEMNEILRQMERTEHSGYCSHGRPTWKQLTMAELDKLFYRGR